MGLQLPGKEPFIYPDPSVSPAIEEAIQAAVDTAVAAIWDTVYPVGSLLFSVNSANPSTYFGGTWVAFGTGRTVVGVDTGDTAFDTVEEIGGAKTHTLTVGELPAHSHPQTGKFLATHSDHTHANVGGGAAEAPNPSSGTGTGFGNTGNTGSGSAHNNLQPYITCYIWKRTA